MATGFLGGRSATGGCVSADQPRRVRSKNTKNRIFEIVVFKRVSDSIAFDMEGADFKNKRQIGEIEVGIAVRI